MGLEVFQYKCENWLIIVDYFSKYSEIAKLENWYASTIITKFKSVYSIVFDIDIPQIVYTDNGTHFENKQFKDCQNI